MINKMQNEQKREGEKLCIQKIENLIFYGMAKKKLIWYLRKSQNKAVISM